MNGNLADILVDPQVLNAYSYASDNPVSKEDPSGLLTATQAQIAQQIIYLAEQTINLLNREIASTPPSGSSRASSEGGGGGGGSGGSSPNLTTGSGSASRGSGGGGGIGLVVGAAAEGGSGQENLGVNNSVGNAAFYNAETGQVTNGSFATEGTTPPYGGSPAERNQKSSIKGAYVGYGGGVFITNAPNVNALAGPGTTYSLNAALGEGISVQYTTAQSVWSLSVSWIGAGYGLDYSSYPSYTVVSPTSQLINLIPR